MRWLKWTFMVFIVAMFSSTVVCWAEVIELKTGQKVEGTLKSVTSADVILDVAGQRVTFPRKKVAAIYFGAPPRTTGATPLNDALRVLKGLQSATSAGINYRDYAPRVTDAKIQVDQMLMDAPDGPVKTALLEALGFYVYASNVWNARVTESNYEEISLNPLYNKCEPLKREVAWLAKESKSSGKLIQPRGIRISIVGASPLFNCANEQVKEAESLLRGQ